MKTDDESLTTDRCKLSIFTHTIKEFTFAQQIMVLDHLLESNIN